MSGMVDTSVWSLALRRRPEDLSPAENQLVDCWEDLVRADQIAIVGPIRQEVLSGIRLQDHFHRLRDRLSAFEDLELTTADYVRAAGFFNTCRSHGITGSHVDMLICSAADRYALPIFSTDPDFRLYAGPLPIRLYEPGEDR